MALDKIHEVDREVDCTPFAFQPGNGMPPAAAWRCARAERLTPAGNRRPPEGAAAS